MLPSPIGSRRRSSASARSSSSASTPSSTCCPSSSAARRPASRAAAAGAVERFCKGIVDAVAPYVVAVKPQVAFFEALGSDGWARARGGLPVRARGRAARDRRRQARRHRLDGTRVRRGLPRASSGAPPLVDALTVNPYLGRDSLDPFFAACRRDGAGLFLLVRTSNAGAADIQDAVLSDGRPLWRHVAGLVDTWGEDLVGARGLSSVGAVVGATAPRIVGEARREMPRAIILLPGVGAQGAGPADVARAFTSGPSSALVNASRSVIYAYRDSPRGRLARGGGGRGRTPLVLGLGGRGLVTVDRTQLARVAAPVLFLLAVTIAVLLVRSGLQRERRRRTRSRRGRCSRAGRKRSWCARATRSRRSPCGPERRSRCSRGSTPVSTPSSCASGSASGSGPDDRRRRRLPWGAVKRSALAVAAVAAVAVTGVARRRRPARPGSRLRRAELGRRQDARRPRGRRRRARWPRSRSS